MRSTWWVVALVAALLAAGCVGSSPDAPDEPEDQAPEPSSEDETTDSAPDANRSEASEDEATERTNASSSDGPRNWTETWNETGNLAGPRIPVIHNRIVDTSDACRGVAFRRPSHVEGTNYRNHTFEVNETVSRIEVNLSWEAQTVPGYGTVPNLDMCLYNATGGEVSRAAADTDQPETITYNRTELDGTGTWTLTVLNFGVDVDYTAAFRALHSVSG